MIKPCIQVGKTSLGFLGLIREITLVRYRKHRVVF